MALRDVVALLRCPHCGSDLSLVAASLRCPSGHSFDVARQGYVNLLPGDAPAAPGDTGAMVRAREAFLQAGHYDQLVRTVVGMCANAAGGEPDGAIVDVGAGTGYFLAAALEHMPGRAGLALDLSKHAARRAARAHARIGAVVCDAWRTLPVAAGTAAVVLNVLAPRNAAEIRRVLRPRGALLLVTPTRDHLRELVPVLGMLGVDERKAERVDADLSPYLLLDRQHQWHGSMTLSHAEISDLVAMGPSAWHTGRDEVARRVDAMADPAPVTASFTVSVYRPRAAPAA